MQATILRMGRQADRSINCKTMHAHLGGVDVLESGIVVLLGVVLPVHQVLQHVFLVVKIAQLIGNDGLGERLVAHGAVGPTYLLLLVGVGLLLLVLQLDQVRAGGDRAAVATHD